MKTNMSWVLLFFVFSMMGFISAAEDGAPPGMVLVKGGTFMMGSDLDIKYLAPVHTVTLDSFCLGKFEVTQAEWQAVMGNNPSYYKNENNPVEQVSWYDAIAYCNKRSEKEGLTPCYSGKGDNIVCDFAADGYRLLTDAEFEYAARGGAQSRNYLFSGSNDVDEVAWYEGNSVGKPHPVGRKKPNELGIYDMSGNVWEWCWDWHDYRYYLKSPAVNPRGAEKGEGHTYRGGGCSGVRHYMIVYHRDGLNAAYKESDMGFRVAKKTGPEGKVPEDMVLVKGGTFQMGTEITGLNGVIPIHKITLNSFYMGKHEVTQEEWAAAMGENYSWFSAAMNPIDCIRWYEAIEYCNRRSKTEGLTPCYSGSGDDIACNFAANGYRLPTEAEWEYAARGGAQSHNYTFSGSNDPGEVAWHIDNISLDRRTGHVGLKKPNELGIYDMTGNAWEWCWDRYMRDYYHESPAENPEGPSTGNRRAIRGGDVYEKAPPIFHRSHARPMSARRGFGFRVVRTVN